MTKENQEKLGITCYLGHVHMNPGQWATPEQALPRVHMMICCPGTTLPRGKFIAIWSLRIYLNFFSFYTNCYREWILNTFTISGAFWNFLLRNLF